MIKLFCEIFSVASVCWALSRNLDRCCCNTDASRFFIHVIGSLVHLNIFNDDCLSKHSSARVFNASNCFFVFFFVASKSYIVVSYSQLLKSRLMTIVRNLCDNIRHILGNYFGAWNIISVSIFQWCVGRMTCDVTCYSKSKLLSIII